MSRRPASRTAEKASRSVARTDVVEGEGELFERVVVWERAAVAAKTSKSWASISVSISITLAAVECQRS